MGTTYNFTKVPKADLASGRLLEIKGKPILINGVEFFDEDNDPIVRMLDENSINELDRDYFIWSVLGFDRKAKDQYGEFSGRKEYEDWFQDYQCVPITREMVERGIKTLEALDAKVFSMPHQPWPEESSTRFAGICYKNQAHEHACTELLQDTDPHDVGNYYFFGRDEQDIAIVKEVFKVYDHREWHYGYPWVNSRWGIGSYEARGVLKSVLDEMDADKDGEFTFLIQWY